MARQYFRGVLGKKLQILVQYHIPNEKCLEKKKEILIQCHIYIYL